MVDPAAKKLPQFALKKLVIYAKYGWSINMDPTLTTNNFCCCCFEVFPTHVISMKL